MSSVSRVAMCGLLWPAAVFGPFVAGSAHAQTPANAQVAAVEAETALPPNVDGKRIFLPNYFTDISPQSAADMVNRVPGFSIEDGDEVRGFGGAAGNVLIDGARPTSKSDDLQSILSRITAENVERIELLEGAAAGALAPGKSLVVNVVRKATSKNSGKWEAQATGVSSGRVKPKLDTSYTFKAGAFSVTAGLHAEIENVENLIGYEGVQSPAGVFLERGPNDDRRRSKYAQASISADGKIGDNKINLNSTYFTGKFQRNWSHIATRTGAVLPYRLDEGQVRNDETRFEFGADIEREIAGWTSKFAALFKQIDGTDFDQAGFNQIGATKNFGRFVADAQSTETVGRFTAKRKFGAHQVEAGGEYAFNALDFTGRYAEGNGVVFVVLPGDIATTEVTETRKEAFVSDSWTISPKLTLESTLTGEWSTISQSGDAAKERSFFYPKPRLKLAWKPLTGYTFRAEVERSVGQLDFGAFADSASVGDSNQNSGNPELRPDQSWNYLLGVEKRWGKRGVINASLVYEAIEDQLSLVPLSGGRVALGNIPDATRYGYNISWTVPLGFLLEGLELEGNYRWRDSELTDPLTGKPRPFSGDQGKNFNTNVTYELPAKKLRMGVYFWQGDHNADYRPDQTFDWPHHHSWGAWIETRAFKFGSLELGFEDLNGNTFSRTRTDYSPDRRSGNISQIQYRERSANGIWYLILKGTL